MSYSSPVPPAGPAWAAVSPSTPSPAPRRRGGLVVVLVLLVGVAVAVGGYVVVAGDDSDPGEPSGGSPEAAARDHAQAVLDGDCDAFLAVLSEGAQAELGDSPAERSAECQRLVGSGSSVADPHLGPVTVESEGNGEAVVAVTVFSDDYEAGNNVFYVTVLDEAGTWKVAQLGWSDEPPR